jgi:hypothetical protein
MKAIILSIVALVIAALPASAQYCDPPGEAAGTTQYPVQSSGMSANRAAYDDLEGVHVTWMAGSSIFARNVKYNFRDETGQWLSSDGMPVNEVNGAGYPTLALKSDNAAAITYHNMSNNYVNLAVDAFRGMAIFSYFDPPDMAPSGNHAFWPQVAVSVNGDIHVLMVEHTQDPGVYPSMIYSRSEDGGESWTSPEEVARVTLLNGCITASSDGKVAIAYLEPVVHGEFSQVKNDVCYYVSEDGRTWDFSTPVNITDYWNDDLEIYCPWGIDAVFDNGGNLNLVWVTGHIDDDGYFLDETAQLWHYSELTGVTHLLAESTDESLTCTYGSVTLPIALPSISHGDFYGYNLLTIIYVGYDETDASGAGECVGDLYGVFGYWDGSYWDGPVNLTETHSPGCEPGECDSENFPSISERMDHAAHPIYVKQKLGEIPDTVYYMPVEPLIPDGIEDDTQLPGEFALLGNYPNPFNLSTMIEFELERGTEVKLAVYDITGALVGVIHEGHLAAGKQAIAWNAGDAASGAYFYRLSTPESSRVRKMVLLK